MESFEKLILQTKKISIWGVGYLGYTSILRLQDCGLKPSVYDFSEERLKHLQNGAYPEKNQLNTWSKNGKIPSVDLSQLEICNTYRELFNNNIHIISFPETQHVNYSALAEIFIEKKEFLSNSLIIFQSAGVPQSIEKNFCNLLIENDIHVDIVTLFRSDWIIEDFLQKDRYRVISGNSEQALDKVKNFLNFLNLEPIELSNIEEAEVFENSKIALSHTIVGFFNQLSLAYPNININELALIALKSVDFKNLSLGLSSVDYKSEQSCENLLRGSAGEYLTILRESNSTNIGFLFFYVDLLKSQKVKSVTILGLSSYNSMKDYRFSPSVILAESLVNENIEVYIHDENIDEEELKTIMPNCKYLNLNQNRITSDSVVIMNLNTQYRYFTQKDIELMNLSNVKFIIDNTGFFKQFSFNKDTIYHQFCDGQLKKVKK